MCRDNGIEMSVYVVAYVYIIFVFSRCVVLCCVGCREWHLG